MIDLSFGDRVAPDWRMNFGKTVLTQILGGLTGEEFARCARMYADQRAELELDGDLFALDASVIDLSMALFPWARWQGTQAAVKIDVLLDLKGDIPAFVSVHEADCHEVASLDEIPVYPGSYYVFDRGQPA